MATEIVFSVGGPASGTLSDGGVQPRAVVEAIRGAIGSVGLRKRLQVAYWIAVLAAGIAEGRRDQPAVAAISSSAQSA